MTDVESIDKRKGPPIYSRFYGGLLLSFIGGFLEAHTFLLRGGVFCNAQTGNIVLMVMNMVQGKFEKGTHYLLSIVAFVLGIFITKVMMDKISLKRRAEWQHILMVIVIGLLIIVGFMPLGLGDNIANLIVALICAMLYNTYRFAGEIPYSNTMLTNNLRIAATHFYDFIFKGKRDALNSFLSYFSVIVVFAFGSVIQVFVADSLKSFSVIICAVILIFILMGEAISMRISLKGRK